MDTIHKSHRLYRGFFKRFLDVVLSSSALIILLPVLIVVTFLVWIKLGTPVIFCQERSGKNGMPFKMYKFRSMTNEQDESGLLLSDTIRLTEFGRYLRSTSLDELPELWNILKGDMSIVGPRPLLPKDVACMDAIQSLRHQVRPGLTGLAQCNGRNVLNWDTKLSLDVEYIETYGFFLDCKIILKTVWKVLRRENAAFENNGCEMDLKAWNEQKELIVRKEG